MRQACLHVPVVSSTPSPNYLAEDLRGSPPAGVGRHWWTWLIAADFRTHQFPIRPGRTAARLGGEALLLGSCEPGPCVMGRCICYPGSLWTGFSVPAVWRHLSIRRAFPGGGSQPPFEILRMTAVVALTVTLIPP